MDNALNFSAALEHLKHGISVARQGWNAHHYLTIQLPDENSKMTLAYIYMTVGDDAADLQGHRVPWVASQTDILENDWVSIPKA